MAKSRSGFGFARRSDFDRVRRAVDHVENGLHQRYPENKDQPRNRFHTRLTEDLAAAEDHNQPTFAKAIILVGLETSDALGDLDATEINVWNRQNTSADAGDYVPVVQFDYDERLYADLGGGSGEGTIIFFDVQSVDCYSGVWCVVPTYVSGCKALPNQKSDGTVEVHPSCTSPYTAEELAATGTGSAAFVYPADDCGNNGIWKELNHCAETGCA